MPRPPSRLLVPALALVALLFLSPTLAAAFPQCATHHPVAERPEHAPGLVSKLWELLSAVWSNGPGLDPNGAKAVPGSEPDSDTGDNGSGLDPDG